MRVPQLQIDWLGKEKGTDRAQSVLIKPLNLRIGIKWHDKETKKPMPKRGWIAGGLNLVTKTALFPLTVLSYAADWMLNSWLGNYYLLSAVAAFGLHFFPQAATKSLDEDLKAKSIPTTLQEHFHTKSIRVYERGNPLSVPYAAGVLTRLSFDTEHPVVSSVLSPVIFGAALLKTTASYIFPSALDAYSASKDVEIDDRTCFIRPPQELSANDFVKKFTGSKQDNINFNNFRSDADKLGKVFYTYVMAHEARHCDQDKKMRGSSLNESDADLYAMKLLETKYPKSPEVKEAREIMEHIRNVLAISGGDPGHFSSVTLRRGSQTPLQAQMEYSAPETLGRMLYEAQSVNADAFKGAKFSRMQNYVLLKKMQAQGVFRIGKNDNAQQAISKKTLAAAAQSYIDSIDYLNVISGGSFIPAIPAGLKLDVSYLNKEYKPVTDKLSNARP